MRYTTIAFAFIIFASIFFTACGNSNNSSEETGERATVISNSDLLRYKNILESAPFNLIFSGTVGKANDTTFFQKGKTPDNSIAATIHYDPRDEKFYWIEFTLNNVPLEATITDVQILLDFTNNFDSGFSSYFKRNFNGIFKDEDAFVDTGKYMNREKGFVFATDGDVALNNMDIKKDPSRREEIISIGSYATINVINMKKPSWLFNDFNNWAVVEK